MTMKQRQPMRQQPASSSLDGNNTTTTKPGMVDASHATNINSDSYEVKRPPVRAEDANKRYLRGHTNEDAYEEDGSPDGRLGEQHSLDSRSSMSSRSQTATSGTSAGGSSSVATSRNLLERSDETSSTGAAKTLPRGAGGGGGKTKTNQQQQHSARRPVLVISMLVISVLIGLLAIAAILMLPSFVSHQISKKLVLKNNSFLLDRWARPNVPMFFKVWLFDIRNAHELMERRDSKPDLKEIGPFVFRLRRQKDILHFSADNLYYSEKKFYHFEPELSCCSINTTVTVPNIPLVAVVDRALGYQLPLVSRFVPRLINRAIQSLREPMFVRKQVRELLFDGYDVQLLKMISRVGSLIGLPQTQQRFAIFKDRNNTWRPDLDGIWAINTGESDRTRFGKVHSWNSYRQLPFWESGSQCNQINGSDGTLFAPPISKTNPIYIFNQEICRSVSLKFMRDSDIRAIQAYRFTLNPMNFAHTQTSQLSGGSLGGGLGSGGGGATSSRRPLTGAAAGQTMANAGRFGGSPLTRQPTMLPNLQQQQQQQQQLQASPPSEPRATGGLGSGVNGGGRRVMLSQAGGQQSMVRETPISMTRFQQPEVVASSNRLDRVARQTGATQQARPSDSVGGGEQSTDWKPLPLNPYPCFCDRKTSNLNGIGVCEFDGLIDLSRCNKQTQAIFGSMPHFYNTDTRLLRSVRGLEPNASKHQTYVDIEPNTGIVLGGKRRVQLNLMIKHNNEIEGFQNINDMLVPLVWFEESAMIPEESAQKFRSLFVERVRLVNILLASLLVGALLVLLINLHLLTTRSRNSKLWQPNWDQDGQLRAKGALKHKLAAASGDASSSGLSSSPSPTKHTISSAGSVGLEAPLLAPTVARTAPK